MLETLESILRGLPPFVDGLIGGVVAYVTLYLVHRNWKITRRPRHKDNDVL